ncbi:MAG TPA: biopolymer transporter ExbD [Longimicrobiales bacterium]|nr:biopolymer transporter ExbD [Longimicrobiales bacterium]
MALMKKKTRASSEVPTSSMADIAFLLLVFFLVTTVFDEEKGLRMVLPELENEVDVSPKNILFLKIQPDGRILIKRGESPSEQPARAGDIGGIWRQEVANNPNLIAAVMTAPTAPYRFMIDVLDQLQAAKADKISLQILE